MISRFFKARVEAFLKNKNVVEPVKETTEKVETNVNPASKKVYAYVNKKLVGEYDSISLCANSLGMSRAMIKRAIDNGVTLENGFLLSLTKK
jgi:hypothetical protein